jgi:hypothetical protein
MAKGSAKRNGFASKRRFGVRKSQTKRPGYKPRIRQNREASWVNGALAVPGMAFGCKGGGTIEQAFDATHPYHLPLPRPVAPYTTIRLSVPLTTNKKVLFFGTELVDVSLPDVVGAQEWSNIICRADGLNGSTAAINGTNECATAALATLNFGKAATVVPSAFTVQIVNGSSISSNVQGPVYIGTSDTQLNLAGDSRTWDTLASQLVQMKAPRVCMSTKLAFRGVKVSAAPMNMAELANFYHFNDDVSSASTFTNTTWTGGTTDERGNGRPCGFTPIFVYNPSAVNLTYLVTVEFRMRFDITNPASAGHTAHKPGSLAAWSAACLDPGLRAVKDISDTVARVGQAMGAVSGAFRAAQNLPMLAD